MDVYMNLSFLMEDDPLIFCQLVLLESYFLGSKNKLHVYTLYMRKKYYVKRY